MLSSRCSLSRCFLCSFSRAFQSGRKECSSARFNEDIRDMSFSPNTKRNAFTENNKSATEENRFITSRKSLSFRCSFSRSLSRLSFRSLSVLFAKGVRCRAFTKRSRRKARAICSQTVSDQKFIHRTRDHPYFRGTNRAASNASFANVSSTTGAALLIRVVSSSSFSSRVKSAVDGVTLVSKCAERTKAVTRKKRTLFTSLEVL